MHVWTFRDTSKPHICTRYSIGSASIYIQPQHPCRWNLPTSTEKTIEQPLHQRSTVTEFHFWNNQRLPRPESVGSADRIPGGTRMPSAAGAPRASGFTRLAISTRALASPIAGTTQLLQLHFIPCHANFPMFPPHAEFGHVMRPDKGGSPVYSLSDGPGNRLGCIHLSGCMNRWPHSVFARVFWLSFFSCSWGRT